MGIDFHGVFQKRVVNSEVGENPTWELIQSHFDEDSWDDNKKWLDEHSQSWLTGEELLYLYENRCHTVMKTGIITAESFVTWDGKCPEIYCGGVCGPNVKVIHADEVSQYKISELPFSHVRVSWRVDVEEKLRYFFDEVKRLTEAHGEIRFVFGFDS